MTGMDDIETAHRDAGMSGALGDAIAALLTSELVHDVAEAATRRAGLGSWQAAPSASGMVDGGEWHASPEVLQAIRAQLACLAPEEVVTLVRHQLTAHSSDDAYAPLVTFLRGLSVTYPVAAPEASQFLAGTESAEFLASHPSIGHAFTEWLCWLTALISERDHLDSSSVATFWRAAGNSPTLAPLMD